VLSRLDRLVIKPIYRGLGDTEVLGWIQSAEALDDLRRRIEARPWAWTGQEPVAPSTAPVVTRHGLEPRHVVLRTFGVALGDTYHFLPGGLARVAPSIDSFVVTNHTGATSKDVWVLEAEGVAAVPRIAPELLARVRAVVESTQVPGLTPRAASDLFWLGRYAERAEAAARLLLVVDNLVEDHVRRSGTPGHAAMRDMLGAVTEVTAVRPGFTGEGAEERLAEPLPSLVRLLTDEQTPGTLAYNAQRAVGAAGDVRELLSQDTPGVLSRLQRTLTEARAEGADVSLQQMASRTLESLTALAGLTAESLIRDPTWAFLDAGRRVERAQVVVRLLRATLGRTRPPVAEALVVESVLRVGDSLITYRRRMAAGVGPTRPAAAALQLLLGEAHNPRSLLFQLERLRDDLAHAPAPRVSESLRALLGRVRDLEPAELGRGQRSHLVDTLTGLEADLRDLSDEIAATHFTTQAPQRVFAVAELVREEP